MKKILKYNFFITRFDGLINVFDEASIKFTSHAYNAIPLFSSKGNFLSSIRLILIVLYVYSFQHLMLCFLLTKVINAPIILVLESK